MGTATRRFLFAMWEGGGTIPPELGVARRLIERGHQVHVLADPTIEDAARAAGCSFASWRRAPYQTSLDPENDLVKDWEVKNPLSMLGRVRDRFIVAPTPGYASDTREEIDKVRPDVVVPDFMIWGAAIAGQGAGLPVALLVPNIWMVPTPGVPVIGPGFMPSTSPLARIRDRAMLTIANRIFDRGLPAVNAVRAEHGLAPIRSLWQQPSTADHIFILTSEAFDFAAPFVPRHARYTGPVLDDPNWAEPWTPPWDAEDNRPLVLVALSSTFQDQAALLRRIVEAMTQLDVRAIVTLGQMIDSDTVHPTSNVAVVKSAPHSLLMPDASVVVTHCGHGTTMKALTSATPMVCIPMGRDQNDTAARVVHQGAGVRLSPKATADKIRDAVQLVLRDTSFRDNAQRVASVIAEEQRQVDIVAELEAVASHVGEPASGIVGSRIASTSA
jgi:MGT family glycosyltransferase